MINDHDWCEVAPLGDLLVRGAHRHPERDVLVLPHARYTYAELLERSLRVARGLIACGVEQGDHVALLAPNGIEFVEGFFGAALIGCVVVPISARHKAHELGYIIENADCAALLTVSGADDYVDFADVLCRALPTLAEAGSGELDLAEAPRLRQAILLRGDGKPGFISRTRFDTAAASISDDVVHRLRRRIRIRDIAAIMYTSGTTANPRGCMMTHEAMTRGPVERATSRLVADRGHISWAGGPLFHIAALAPLIGAIGAGGTYLTDIYFDAGRAIDLMAAEHVTVAWPWFPAPMQSILAHPDFDAGRLDSLRYLFLIGPRVLITQVQNLFPDAELVAACGMTETAGIYALSEPDETFEDRSGAQGKPAPGMQIRIVDPETGTEQPVGVPGEILIRGYCVTDGYYKDPVKTAEAFDSDGWLRTGDLYSRTDSGCLVFHGRLKDMLKVGGENVAAIEVESFLCEHPAVLTAAIVGRPDDRLDEVPVAFVETRSGATLTEKELIAFCEGKISRYKIPRAVFFVEPGNWPMSATKINKRELRARLTAPPLSIAR
ncbi:acyl--CoA ligase [Nocardia sp. CA2R105]|uniref:class I adenylate-forming enzyme family protein n=1 Tax=Nocardia coffeae TaxID=2873381 RepID=UPI001CA6E96D|nr:class I adenylate-forming enzyme family protein [Nocardia coffeae]MBY8860385.1 acyl--CoA ligase [Nocardia coffeae]